MEKYGQKRERNLNKIKEEAFDNRKQFLESNLQNNLNSPSNAEKSHERSQSSLEERGLLENPILTRKYIKEMEILVRSNS